MGRPKKELKKIHRKKARRAKEKVKLHLKGEVRQQSLTQLAKMFLKRRKKFEKKPS